MVIYHMSFDLAFFNQHATHFKAPEGYLVIDHETDHIEIKQHIDQNDTALFMSLNYTCTAIVLLTFHKGHFGSLNWDTDHLVFRLETMASGTMPPFGGIHLTRDFKTRGFRDHDFTYSHHVIEINKTFLSWQNDHFVLDDKNPLRFTLEKSQVIPARVMSNHISIVLGVVCLILLIIYMWFKI